MSLSSEEFGSPVGSFEDSVFTATSYFSALVLDQTLDALPTSHIVVEMPPTSTEFQFGVPSVAQPPASAAPVMTMVPPTTMPVPSGGTAGPQPTPLVAAPQPPLVVAASQPPMVAVGPQPPLVAASQPPLVVAAPQPPLVAAASQPPMFAAPQPPAPGLQMDPFDVMMANDDPVIGQAPAFPFFGAPAVVPQVAAPQVLYAPAVMNGQSVFLPVQGPYQEGPPAKRGRWNGNRGRGGGRHGGGASRGGGGGRGRPRTSGRTDEQQQMYQMGRALRKCSGCLNFYMPVGHFWRDCPCNPANGGKPRIAVPVTGTASGAGPSASG